MDCSTFLRGGGLILAYYFFSIGYRTFSKNIFDAKVVNKNTDVFINIPITGLLKDSNNLRQRQWTLLVIT